MFGKIKVDTPSEICVKRRDGAMRFLNKQMNVKIQNDTGLRSFRKKWYLILLRFLFALFLAYLMVRIVIFNQLLSVNVKSAKLNGASGILTDISAIPFIIFSALYGYLYSLNLYLALFITALILNADRAYLMTPFMIAMFLYSMFSQYRWFRTKTKTVLAFLTGFASMLLINGVCGNYIANRRFGESVVKSIFIFHNALDILESNIICCVALYLFFNKFPDIIKCIFPLGYGYTREYVEDLVFQKSVRKNQLSVRITFIIILEALLLCAFSILFVDLLFPEIREMVNANMGGGTMSEEKAVFRFNDYGMSFSIKMLLMEMSIAIPVASMINFYTKMRIASPIGQLSDYMLNFTDTTDENRTEYMQVLRDNPINTHDEITTLYYSTLITLNDVTGYIEQIKEEQKLKEDLRVAEAASEAKSSFLSNMSHEIRTPINAVLGMNEMILRESEEPQTLEYATTIESAGSTLLSLVNDILDFSKIEAGKMEILPVQYRLSSVVNDLVNMIAQRAANKNLEFKITVDESIPDMLFGDEIRIKQCATNILTNAVKYTQEGSVELCFAYEKKDEETIALTVRVIDTGIGIKEEDINKLYSPFERIEEIRNRTIEGTGLGMSIVKKLLAMMDTRLMVNSVYGEGSDFSFTVDQKVVEWEGIGDFEARYKETIGQRKKYKESFHAPDAKILVVDDTKMNLTVILGLLKKTKVQVDTAESGKETLQLVQKNTYDMIFLDHRMPEMDGIETLEAMKELPGNLNKNTVCIALTANAVSGARQTYLDAGFQDYLSKPIDADRLEKMLMENLPPEKVIRSGEDGFDTDDADVQKTSSYRDELSKYTGINIEEAIKNCGGEELVESVISDFRDNIPEKLRLIREYEEAGDIRNYTIQVHALKSSARIIGAGELSEKAAYLEECGNADKTDEIKEKTPEILKLLESYEEHLKADKKDEDTRPEISAEELQNAFRDMKELMEAFDYDNVAEIYKMLSGYKVPSELKEKFELVGKYIGLVDREKLLELL